MSITEESQLLELDGEEETEFSEESSPDGENEKGDEGEGVEQFVDVIDVKADDLIDSKTVVSINLPKVAIEVINGRTQVAKRSPVVITLHDNPKVCSNLIEAANKGSISFTLTTYVDLEKTQVSDVWVLEEARITAIDFGQVVTVPQPEQRVIQCELEYKKLSINGVKI